MFIQNAPPEDPAASASRPELVEVDRYGIPLDVFGDYPPPEFFEVIGRIVAINAKIEYLKERLDNLPPSETTGIKKVQQFLKRDSSGRMDRNAIVHSFWTFGASTENPNLILGIRYKVRKLASGEIATTSIRDVPDSEREQDIVQFELVGLRKILKRDLATMQVGELAYSEVMLQWAARQDPTAAGAFGGS
ncbi:MULTISPECIES: hypothetical protein [Cryobacterium]|uniref:Uncharacterized protein n=1 Tax=Cryobacterium breve TaxID=1259258 RepID=A0ABY2JCM9_9MICO|nr:MULTISPECIES: hypothetical protein [Cryobacterium]TFC91329.1 hypothetical protein E3T20_13870 [Cryobacterium sp. TmT3-12]TFD01354.1 hypothetical protein E3O65_01525 [Cryobacterium breve]